jgi:hypothetical protein
MAATDERVGVLWRDRAGGQDRVVFSQFSPDLTLLTSAELTPPSIDGSSSKFALTPQPVAGVLPGMRWIVAGWAAASGGNGKQLVTETIDAAGNVGAPLVIEAFEQSGDRLGGRIALASNAGGALLAWERATGFPHEVRASVISADGTSRAAPVVIATDQLLPGYVYVQGATVVGNEFYVATLLWEGGVSFARLDGQGQLLGSFDVAPPIDGNVEYMVPVSDPTALRMIYVHGASSGLGDATLGWARWDTTGQLLSSSEEIEPIARRNLPTHGPYAVGLGDDTLVLVPSYSSTTSQTSTRRLGPTGELVAAPREIIRAPVLWSFAMARRGPDVLIGWGDFRGGIRVLRLAP